MKEGIEVAETDGVGSPGTLEDVEVEADVEAQSAELTEKVDVDAAVLEIPEDVGINEFKAIEDGAAGPSSNTECLDKMISSRSCLRNALTVWLHCAAAYASFSSSGRAGLLLHCLQGLACAVCLMQLCSTRRGRWAAVGQLPLPF